jgi:hypothetical protein
MQFDAARRACILPPHMGACRVCGKWVGFFGSVHSECSAQRESEDAIRRQADADRATPERPPKSESLDSTLLRRMLAVRSAPAIKERDDCFTVRVRGSRYPSNMGIARWKLYCLLAPGDVLKLVAEPDNPHDEFAIAVWGTDPRGKDLHLGYVPADFAASITQQEIKRGITPKAWVLEKHESEHNGREMLIIQIDLHLENSSDHPD